MKAPLGTGERFHALVQKLVSKGHTYESAKAIAATAGREKYGKKKFQKLAAAGKKNK
jgi:hypothetical protein